MQETIANWRGKRRERPNGSEGMACVRRAAVNKCNDVSHDDRIRMPVLSAERRRGNLILVTSTMLVRQMQWHSIQSHKHTPQLYVRLFIIIIIIYIELNCSWVGAFAAASPSHGHGMPIRVMGRK